MSIRCYLFIFFIFLFYIELPAKTHFLVMGGSGDSPLASNLFTTYVKTFVEIAQEKQWTGRIFFDGDHPSGFQKIKKAGKDFPIEKMNPENFQTGLNSLNSEKIESGDQILIQIISHGASKLSNETSHSFYCGDTICPMDDLKDYILKLEAKGVKVAIVDTSCYSGNSIKLATDKTCVITTTSEDDVSFSLQVGRLLKSLENEPNLEAAYLAQRKKGLRKFFGQPQISTPAGLRVKEVFDNILGLVNFADNALTEGSTCTDCNSKEKNQLPEVFKNLPSVKKYLKAYGEYEDERQRVLNIYLNEVVSYSDSTPVVCKDNDKDLNFAKKDFILLDNSLFFGKPEIINCITTSREKFLREDPAFKRAFEAWVSIGTNFIPMEYDINKSIFTIKTQNPLRKIALKVHHAERDLYLELYNAEKKSRGPNPCSEFLL